MAQRVARPRIILRLVAEFAVIVLGVLVALQLEGWRDLLLDREREQEQLEALRADFEVNVRVLRETITQQQRALDAAETFLLQFGPEAGDLDADSVAMWLALGTSWYGFEAVTGAYDALLNTGDIGLISDRELRQGLAQFYGIVSSGFEDHENEMDLLALLQAESSGQARRLVAPSGALRGFQGADPRAADELLRNEDVGGLLVWKIAVAGNRMAWLEDLQRRADSILSRTDGPP